MVMKKTGNSVTFQVSPRKRKCSYSVMDGAQEIFLLSIGTDVIWVVWLNRKSNGNGRSRQVSGMNVTMRKCANARFEIKIDVTNHDTE